MLSFKNTTKAFTLIELLVVIAIIGIMSAIVIGNLTGGKQKARDAKRVSDMAQIQLAYELFFDRCNVYPANITNVNYACPTNGAIVLNNYISNIPTDPAPGTGYQYTLNESNTDYVLRVQMETVNAALQDDVDGAAVLSSVNCNDANRYYCVQPR